MSLSMSTCRKLRHITRKEKDNASESLLRSTVTSAAQQSRKEKPQDTVKLDPHHKTPTHGIIPAANPINKPRDDENPPIREFAAYFLDCPVELMTLVNFSNPC